ADTKIVMESDQQVTFDLPEGFIAEDKENAKVTVDNIVPVDSNAKFSPYAEASHEVLDNTAPEASGKLLKNGGIFLTFSEKVASVVETDFDEVLVNGLKLADSVYLAEADVTNDDEDAVKISVEASETTVSGETYLYIDVDGDEELNHDKDIVLDQVEGEDGKDSWYVADEDGNPTADLKPANLNKVDSVVVNVKEEADTTDTSELKNSLKAGNVTIK